jgi:hypothetical protein
LCGWPSGRAVFRGRKAGTGDREPDAGEPHVRIDERGTGNEAWSRYCGTAGKPGGKRRKQTSTYTKRASLRLYRAFIVIGRTAFAGPSCLLHERGDF